MMRSV
jgi:hypothetical protein